ncbi:MAG TPA: serine/threonine-protein kinase, partial [Candidatus Rubrimentiphilum sp.]|nr:serine/threonine-protein kinase [Candidatus Rubrimentiphilum sp.]
MAETKLVAKRYRIIAKKGEGALSIVYQAHDTVLERDVALKVLKTGPGIDAHAVERFDSEARSAARITDPHVAAIYDVIGSELGSAIVMEFVDGPSLAQRLKVVGALPEATAVRYARQIAQALAAAHAHGLVHRDVKPANVLLTANDEVKVVDFGLVKALDSTAATITGSGMLVGSVHYVSPEQAQGKAVSPASDLYSLGVVIYQMCSGDLPYGGESPVAIALAHVTNPVPSRRALEHVMSPGLALIVARLLEKDPARRYRSAGEVVNALDALTGEESKSVSAAPDAPTIVTAIPVARTRNPILTQLRNRARNMDLRRLALATGCAILVATFLAFASPASRSRAHVVAAAPVVKHTRAVLVTVPQLQGM